MNDATRTSDEHLEVGDRCMIVSATIHHEYIGRECTIIGPLQDYGFGYPEYEISVQGVTGVRIVSRPRHLRKIRPPREDLQLVRWDQCPWQPVAITTLEGAV